MASKLRPPDQALILHFTHIGNLPSILAAGMLVADADAHAAGLATDVGDAGVKSRRRTVPVNCGPGGFVADYVPFYFAPRSPMMYRIARDHRDDVEGRYPDGDDPLVYLVSSVDQVISADLRWVASDGNCATAVTRFLATRDELREHIDWQLMGQAMWNDTPEDPDRMRRRMAEFLVYRHCPLSVMLGYVVRTEERRDQLLGALSDAGVAGAYVDVRPTWYYGDTRRR
jgi:hypothetical protein